MPIRSAQYAYQTGTVCTPPYTVTSTHGAGGAPHAHRRGGDCSESAAGGFPLEPPPHAQTGGYRRSLPHEERRCRRRSEGQEPRSRGRRGAGARDPFSEYWRQYTPYKLKIYLKKLHQSMIWCRSILVSVCHTLKSMSIVCSGRGFPPLSVPECKKSRCQGGAKAPTQCLPLTYTAFFVLYSARKGGKPLYIVYMFGFFLFCLYSVVAVCVGGVPLVLSAPHPLRSPPKPPRRGGKGGALIGAQRPTTARGRTAERPEEPERAVRGRNRRGSERGGGRIGSERRAKNPRT